MGLCGFGVGSFNGRCCYGALAIFGACSGPRVLAKFLHIYSENTYNGLPILLAPFALPGALVRHMGRPTRPAWQANATPIGMVAAARRSNPITK
ncbi:hypothetical protein METHP14_260023 [Pseudomonas sp. P14-2025]